MVQLPTLPYAYDALEPYVDTETMKVHHTKHHQGYTNKYNAALAEYPELQQKSVEELLENLDKLPNAIRSAVRNNGGGFYNHSLFWKMMTPNSSGAPVGDLAQKIDETFGSFDTFKDEFGKAAVTVFGSGWAWLTIDDKKRIEIMVTPQQDTVISNGFQPILGLDVWEHAYYLKHQNKRPDYVAAWWNVVNWDYVEELYQKVLAGGKVTV
jgi:superoxide dismutase, Fe-Mn family